MSSDAVRRLWELFEAREWELAGAQLHDDFVADWPQTGERFVGRDNFVAMNRAHPAPDWHIDVRRVVGSGDEVGAEVYVTTAEGTDIAVGFYETRDGRVARATEYWTELGDKPTPAWREQWTERMDGS